MSLAGLINRLNPSSWPLSFKVPILVAVLMFAVSASITNRVLARLEVSQEQHLQQLASAYLDGLSASLIPAVFREDVWEVFDTLDRSRESYKGLNVKWTIVTNADGKILAASDPSRFPSDRNVEMATLVHFAAGGDVTLDEENATAFLVRALPYQERVIGKIYAEADIGSLLQERNEVFRTLLLTNLLLTLLLASVGYFAASRMIKPVRIMSKHLEEASQGKIELIPDTILVRQGREFRRLFGGYNMLSQAVKERELMAIELAEEEKVASLGRLASGMAHEINNPLGGILSLTALTLEDMKEDDPNRENLDEVVKQTQRCRDIVKGLLEFSRHSEVNTEPTDLNRILQETLSLIARQAQFFNISVVENWDPRLPSVMADKSQLQQVFMNVLMNAVQAMQEKGVITITTRHNAAASSVELLISDTGCGIPPEEVDQIFDPFFTSKASGQGTGLGLSIAYGIITSHRGSISVASEVGKGSTFTIRLPVSPTAPREEQE